MIILTLMSPHLSSSTLNFASERWYNMSPILLDSDILVMRIISWMSSMFAPTNVSILSCVALHRMTSLITYSADTWGNKVRDDIVNVHIKICKCVACLHQHVANCFALSECGRLPRSINYKSKCVKNFDILYRSSRNCILGHFKAYFEDNNFIFSSVCQAKK